MARRNVALPANGGAASASTTFAPAANYPPAGAINGDRTTTGWSTGGGWCHNPFAPEVAAVAWLRVDFSSLMLLDEIDVITYGSASAPTLTTPVDGSYGLTAFTVQSWNGVTWQTVTSVSSNGFVWRQFTGLSVTTTAIRLTGFAAPDDTARVLEFEAWGDVATSALLRHKSGAGAHKPARLKRRGR